MNTEFESIENLETACRVALHHQYEASIEMIRNALSACPDDQWTTEINGIPFWHIAYHIIFFLDLYSGDSKELQESFVCPSFAEEGNFFLGERPSSIFTKVELVDYLNVAEQKSISIIKNLNAKQLTRPSAVEWKPGRTVFELLCENLRHMHHHIGQLHFILRVDSKSVPKWIDRLEG